MNKKIQPSANKTINCKRKSYNFKTNTSIHPSIQLNYQNEQLEIELSQEIEEKERKTRINYWRELRKNLRIRSFVRNHQK